MKVTKKSRSHVTALILLVIIAASYAINTNVKAPTVPPAISPTPTVAPLPHTDFREISTGDTSKKQAIITIDAGFGERSAEGLLAALSKHKIKASFFLVGTWIEDHQELTRRIVKEGHEVFNHSYDHRMYTQLTADEIKADLQKMDDVLFSTAGVRTRPYYRAPSGDRNEAVNRAAAEAGFQSIYWDVDPQDWRLDVSGETIKSRVLAKIHPGAIVLLHIADSTTGDIADELFTALEKQGYKLVSLTEGL
jgi:peptidoglycan-N-acetylmuramic acid deacetylase